MHAEAYRPIREIKFTTGPGKTDHERVQPGDSGIKIVDLPEGGENRLGEE